MNLLSYLLSTSPEVLRELPIDPMPSYEGAFLKMFLILIALLVGICFVIWMLKKFSQGAWNHAGTSKEIKVLERRPISHKTTLYRLKIGKSEVLISESQLEVRTLLKVREPCQGKAQSQDDE